MKTFKKIVKTILAVLCFTAIILAGGEKPDGSVDFVWTLFWISVAYLSGRGFFKLEKLGCYEEDC